MFAEIVLLRKLGGALDTLTYSVPSNLKVSSGQVVSVPFGKQKTMGVVVGFSKERPDFQVKDILENVGQELFLQNWQIEIAKWISDYYFCPLSKVIPLFLPKKIWDIDLLNNRLSKAKSNKNEKQIKIILQGKEHVLTTKQKKIMETIMENPGGKFLLHGVTGSGKTEIYIRLSKKCIEKGQQVLILVPEIILTPQLVDHFQKHFDDPVEVIHSRLTENERNRAWLRIFRKETKVVIGSRSALFSPFQNLGLIVMDEEHEWTYKQEQMPRYHGREVAKKMSDLTGATIVFGTATPNIETYFKSNEEGGKKIELLELPERVQETAMPKSTIVDLREEIKKGNFGIFSERLVTEIAQALSQKKQIILFINRRGVAPAVICRDCGYVERCMDCQVALVVHKSKGYELLCHHCGKSQEPKTFCPSCKSTRIRWIGVGTERVEEEIKKTFSLANVFRADGDTMTKKKDYDTLYQKLKDHEIDILVGTQIIAKGLDLPNVHLVGVILADTSLHFPDFRAAERTFQLLTQVSGRAGRRDERGEVIIQTYSPDHYALLSAQNHDYETFYKNEIAIRQEYEYPPFSTIIKLSYSDSDEQKCHKEVARMESLLAKENDSQIRIAVTPALIPKMRGKYNWEIILRGKNPEHLLKKILPLPENWKIDRNPIN